MNADTTPAWCERLYHAKATELILYGRALGLSHAEAEDVVQETFLALLQRETEPDNPAHYCVRSFRNRALNYRRTFWRRLTRELESQRWFERGPEESPAERAAILAWAVRGCLEWQCDGLRPPLIVEAATQAYRAEMNPLSDFIADACLIDPQAWAPGDKLKAAYEAWALKNGETPVNARTYGKALRACGATSTTQRTNAGVTRGWKGIGLLTAPPSNAAALVAE